MMFTSTVDARSDATVMRLSGILNARTYQQVRDSVVEAVLDEACAVIVDVDGLEVQDCESWAVFTSARWCVQQWPEIPIVLVSSKPAVRGRLVALAVSRYVPVYETVADAREAIGDGVARFRHRAREWFEPRSCSVNAALLFVHEHLVAWSMRDRIPVASTAVTVLAENVLAHTGSSFDIRLAGTDDEVIVAVSDSNPALAVRRERPPGSSPAGLDIMSSLCQRWGNTPTSSGKTVWARIGPKDSFSRIGGLRR